jgi:hypothetical protein
VRIGSQSVCGVCGAPATDQVWIEVGRRTLVKDLCAGHIHELIAGTRPENSAPLRLADPVQWEQGGRVTKTPQTDHGA